jgi:hypothetical protein
MLSNPFRRSAPIAPDVRIRPLYMNPPVNEMPYSSPNSDKDTKLASAEMKSKLSAAYEMAKAVKPQYDKINSRFDIRNPPPNPFIRGIYFLAPNVRPDEELQRLFTKDLYKKEEKKLTDITNANYGLLAAEARGIPRDVILNNISPYIQPSKRQYDKSPDTIFDDTVKQYISYPTHVPSINSNMSPFAPAGSIPNLGFS